MNKIIGAALLAGLSLAAFSTQAADIYLRKTTASTQLSPTPGVLTTIMSVSVPAGTWTVSGKASIVNFNGEDYNRCRVVAGSIIVDSSTAMTGRLDGFPAVATIVNQGAITTTSTRTFKLLCQHDFAVTGQYVDPDATLLVVRAPGPLN